MRIFSTLFASPAHLSTPADHSLCPAVPWCPSAPLFACVPAVFVQLEVSWHLNAVLNVLGRWLFGWALARVVVAVMSGRLRAVAWVLTLRALVPLAALSYSGYLLQDIPMSLLPSWVDTGVTTLYAAWAWIALSFPLATAGTLLLALPMYLLVERPLSLIVRRAA